MKQQTNKTHTKIKTSSKCVMTCTFNIIYEIGTIQNLAIFQKIQNIDLKNTCRQA